MAKGGGGAWKVAYADFVTAMMAFFLVMWICGQDQQLRRAVSHYFNDPYSTNLIGTSKRPNRSGSTAELNDTGSVPQAESVALGRGRTPYTSQLQKSPATKAVSDWIQSDEGSMQHWRDRARQAREQAADSREVREKTNSVNEVASFQLSKQLREEVAREIPSQIPSVFQDLLYDAISKVNWNQIADDLLAQ
jgi:flagellar motor protein MotB